MRKDLKIAAMFPGQGAQYVGMGKSLYENSVKAKEVMDKASEVLGFDLPKMCFEGSTEDLTKTEISQPAILAVSVAALEALKEKVGDFTPFISGGLSLGEYSALVASGSISLEDALSVVRQRGQFMSEACSEKEGGMLSLIGLDREQAKSVCDKIEGKYIAVANLNSPGQIVLSGEKEAVEEAAVVAKEAGAKRSVVLNVAGGFHSELMESAAVKLKPVLDAVSINVAGASKSVTNVTGKVVTETDDIKDILVKQVTGAVYWEDCIATMSSEGADCFVEFGCGKVLSGLMRRIDRKAACSNVEDVDSLDKCVEFLNSL